MRASARKLTAKSIGYTMADNAFVRIDDCSRAQALADTLSPDQLHRSLDRYAERAVQYPTCSAQSYRWSLMQVELHATDLVFRSAATLKPLYEQLVRESVLSVKAGAGCHLPRPSDHPAAGPGDRLGSSSPHRR